MYIVEHHCLHIGVQRNYTHFYEGPAVVNTKIPRQYKIKCILNSGYNVFRCGYNAFLVVDTM